MTQTTEIQEDTEDQPLFVSELSEFIPLLEDWHHRQVMTVEHLQTVPPGQEVQVEDEAPLILEGEALRAYRLGIGLALHYLGNLPFSTERAEPGVH